MDVVQAMLSRHIPGPCQHRCDRVRLQLIGRSGDPVNWRNMTIWPCWNRWQMNVLPWHTPPKKNNCQKKTMDQVITSLTAREYPFAAVSRALFSSCPILSHPVPSRPINLIHPNVNDQLENAPNWKNGGNRNPQRIIWSIPTGESPLTSILGIPCFVV